MSYRPNDPFRAAGRSAAQAAMDACQSAQTLCGAGIPRSALVYSHTARAALDELDAMLATMIEEDEVERKKKGEKR